MVNLPADDGGVNLVPVTSVELFQIKLRQQLALGDFEELSRIMAAHDDLAGQRTQMDEAEWRSQMMFIHRRLVTLGFHDPVPTEVLHGLQLERLEQITDFVLENLAEEKDPEAGDGESHGDERPEPVDWYPIIFRLQAFYRTASPMVWRNDVPLQDLEAALHWMTVIEAEENFRWAHVVTVGNGHFKNRAARNRAIRPWQRAIRRAAPPVQREKPTKEAFMANLAMIGVVHVEG